LIPVLLRLGPFSVRSYGVMLVIAFLLGTYWALKSARRRGIPEERIFSLVGCILVSSIAGSRLHFVLAHPSSYANPLDFFRIWEGGLTLYGGLIAAVVFSYLYLRKHHLPFLLVADITAPAIAFGEGITRIGCFLNGCCFGSVCSGGLSFHYPSDSYAAQTLGDVGIYPAQLFLSAAMFLLFILLWRLDRKKMRTGVLFGLYLTGQGIARYAVDFYRYYEPVDRITNLGAWIETKSQLIALILAVSGAILTLDRLRNPPPSVERPAQ
jgi:phosphatidylglycerol---prolipoprotein diacylglyceryl transferase